MSKLFHMHRKGMLSGWVLSLALFVLAGVVYGPFLSKLGFYWDDWAFAWIRSRAGVQGLIDMFNVSRPIRGWMEILLNPLFGINPLAWQAYSLFMRLTASISFLYLLLALWPKRRAESVLAAGILIVYPGFSQQPLAMVYHYFWTFETVFFLSLYLMVCSLKRERIIWWMYISSVLLATLQLIAMEYLTGLELLRPVVLWLVLSNIPSFRMRLKKVVLLEMPYMVVLSGYLYWRFFLFQNAIYSPSLLGDMKVSPVVTILQLFSSITRALVEVNLTPWLRIIQLPDFALLGISLTLLYVLVFVILLFGTVRLLSLVGFDDQLHKPSLDWVLVGFIGMFCAGLPFFVAKLPFRAIFPEDRFLLPFIPLVGIFVAGLVSLIKNQGQRNLLAALLIAFSAGYQIQNLISFRDDWKTQKNFLWQMAWRAPGLQEGTILLSEDYDTFLYNDDEAISAMLNLNYAPHTASDLVNYQFISLRLGKHLPAMLESIPSEGSPYVLIRYSPPACLHVLDTTYDEYLVVSSSRSRGVGLTMPGLFGVPEEVGRALPLSNTARIISDPSSMSVLPIDSMGMEPEHRWCFYYLKADLARQQSEWDVAASLGDAAFAKSFAPDDPYEYLIFIESYARTRRWKDARLLTEQVAENSPLLKPALCGLWQRVGKNVQVNSDEQAVIINVQQDLNICPLK